MMKQVANSQIIRQINRFAILEAIRLHGPISRSLLSQELELSLPTVMRIAQELLDQDLIVDLGLTKSSGGRPPSMLVFNSEAYAVIGVDLGGTNMVGTVVDLAGSIQHEVSFAHKDSHKDKLTLLIQFIEELIDAPRPKNQKLRGVGIGVPGTTTVPEGKVIWAPSLAWRDLPLQSILVEKFDLPVFVENDVNLAALGEWGFGAGKDTCSMVNISIGTGIGAGIIIDGNLYRGYNQAAGEIGFMIPSVDFLGKRYDHFGGLESLASGTGVARRAAEKLAGIMDQDDLERIIAKDIFDAAREGQKWAVELVQETADLLSLGVGNITAFFNPEIIIIGGGLSRSADMFIPRIIQQLDGVVPFLPKIVASPLGRRAPAMGAVMQVLNGTTEYLVIDQRI